MENPRVQLLLKEKIIYPDIRRTEFNNKIELGTLLRKKMSDDKYYLIPVINEYYSISNKIINQKIAFYFNGEVYKHLILFVKSDNFCILDPNQEPEEERIKKKYIPKPKH